MAEERIGLTIEAAVRRLESLQELVRTLDTIIEKKKELARAEEQAVKVAKKVAEAQKQQEKQMADLIKKADAWRKTIQETTKAQEKVAKETKKLTDAEKKLEQSTKRLDKVEEKIVGTLRAMGQTSEQAHAQLEAMESGFTRAGASAEDYEAMIARLEAQLRILRKRLKMQVGGLQETVMWWKRVVIFWGVAAIPLRAVFSLVESVTKKLGEGSAQLQEYSEAQLEVIETMDAYVRKTVMAQAEAGLFTKLILGLKLSGDALTKMWTDQELLLDILNKRYDKAAVGLMTLRAETEFLKARTEELASVGLGLMAEKLEEQRQEILATSESAKEYIEAIINLTFGSREAYEAATWLNKALFEQGLAYEYALSRAEALTALMAPQREAVTRLSALYVERAEMQQAAADRAEEAEERQAKAAQSLADQIERIWRQLYEVTLPRMFEDYEARMARAAEDLSRRIERIIEDHNIRMARIAEDLAVRLAAIQAAMQKRIEDEQKAYQDRMEDLERSHRDNLRDIRQRFREDMRRIDEKYGEEETKLNKSYQAKLRWIEVFGRKDLIEDLKKWKRDEQKELDDRRKREEREARRERRQARKREMREYKRRQRLLRKEHKERLKEIRKQAAIAARLAKEAAARAAAREEQQYELRKKRAEEDAARRAAREKEEYEERRKRAEEDAARRAEEQKSSQAAIEKIVDKGYKKQKKLMNTAIRIQEGIHRVAMKEYERITEKGGKRAGESYVGEFDHEMRRLEEKALDPATRVMTEWGEDEEERMGERGESAAEEWARRFKEWFRDSWIPPDIPGPTVRGPGFQAGLRYVPGKMEAVIHRGGAVLHAREAEAYRALTARVGALSRLQTVSTSRVYHEGGLEFNIGSITSEMDMLKLLGLVDRKLGTRVRRRMKFGGGRR